MILRDWYSGIMTPFQGVEAGSIPVSRSFVKQMSEARPVGAARLAN